MKCGQCGHEVRDSLLFCPKCGRKLAQSLAPSQRPPAGDVVAGPESSGCGWSLAVLLGATLIVLAIAGLGVAGVRYGMRDRANTERQAAQEHYKKGVSHLAQEEFELAIAELEVAARLNPEDGQTLAKLADARKRLEVEPTPTPMLLQEILAAYLDELCAAHAAGEWEKVFELADRLLAKDATYHRSEVDQMLFDGFYHSGLQLVEQDRMREAVRLLDRALALQPGNADVQRAQQLATLYLTAMSHWNADWPKVTEALDAIYRLAPDYKDVRQRLHDAHVGYGDLLIRQQEWCKAEKEYTRALEIMAGSSVAGRRQDASAWCKATPTQPVPETTGTPESKSPEGEATSTPESETPTGPSGVYAGRLVERTVTDGTKMFIRGKVLDKEGEGVQDVQVQIRAWDWSAIAVSDGSGQYSFDGLSNTVTYTLSLLNLPSQELDVAGIWGKITWVNFEEVP